MDIPTTLSRRMFLKGLAGGALALGVRRRALGNSQRLRMSLPPLQDVLPLGFAHNEGMFTDAGLDVEFAGFSSIRERNTALLSNNLDGVVSDITNLILNRGNVEADLVITSTAFELIDDTRQVALLSSGFFNVQDLDTLLRRLNDRLQNSITLSRRTDFELITDELLEAAGATIDPDVFYADTDDLVNAATLLAGGSVLAAVLPEPLAILTEQNELIEEQFLSKTVSSFDQIVLPPSVVVFRRDVIEQCPEDVATFYQVYFDAIRLINETDKDEVRESAIESTIEFFLPGLTRDELPPNFGEDYQIPLFPEPRVLTEEEFERVRRWVDRKGYLFGFVDYEKAVDFQFIS